MTKRMGAGVRLEGNTVITSGVIEHLVGAPVMATDLRITRRYFAEKGDQVEVIRLYGSMELAPLVGLADRIVDLVDTGNTLRANGLTVLETIARISARLIVNKAAMKMKNVEVKRMLVAFARAAEHGPQISSEGGTP